MWISWLGWEAECKAIPKELSVMGKVNSGVLNERGNLIAAGVLQGQENGRIEISVSSS